MVPQTFPSTYETANGQQRMVVFFLSSVSGLVRWVDYIPVKFATLENQENNSYNNNGVILVDPLSSTTNLQEWKDYIPVFADATAENAWTVSSDGFIPVGYFTKPTLALDFANMTTLDSRITFTRASGATYFDSSGVLQTAASDVARFDHNPTTLAPLGLLIEEQRTNSIRNNTMQGAVAGTPGTLPTNWLLNNTGGLTTNVIGTGTSNGINYVDLQITGTSTGTLYQLSFDANTQISASSGQAWTGSFWISQTAGTLTGVNAVNVRVSARDSGGSTLATTDSSAITLSSTLARYSSVYSSLPASTAYVQESLRVSLTNSTAIDITLRIGLPQLELGAFATSVIPTTTAAATRNADAASMTSTNFSSWYRADEGTFQTSFITPVTTPSGTFPVVLAAHDGTTGNRILLSTNAFFNCRVGITTNGTGQSDYSAGAFVTANNLATWNLAYKVNDQAASANGNSAVTDTSVLIPTVNELGIGNRPGGQTCTGYFRKIAFYPTRLSNEQLQALTR